MDNATGPEAYTAEQRETLESGLRILARMIAREHLRREGALATTDPKEETGANEKP